jgi:hypothetical protein
MTKTLKKMGKKEFKKSKDLKDCGELSIKSNLKKGKLYKNLQKKAPLNKNYLKLAPFFECFLQ